MRPSRYAPDGGVDTRQHGTDHQRVSTVSIWIFIRSSPSVDWPAKGTLVNVPRARSSRLPRESIMTLFERLVGDPLFTSAIRKSSSVASDPASSPGLGRPNGRYLPPRRISLSTNPMRGQIQGAPGTLHILPSHMWPPGPGRDDGPGENHHRDREEYNCGDDYQEDPDRSLIFGQYYCWRQRAIIGSLNFNKSGMTTRLDLLGHRYRIQSNDRDHRTQ